MYKDIMAGHVVMKMVAWFMLHQISKIIIIILNMECFGVYMVEFLTYLFQQVLEVDLVLCT